MRTVSKDDPRPPYRQVADIVREAIKSGEWAPGAKLPSARSLAAQLGAANNTVQAGFDVLKRQGYLFSAGTRGTFVRDPLPDSSNDDLSDADLRLRVDTLDAQVKELGDRLAQLEEGGRAPK